MGVARRGTAKQVALSNVNLIRYDEGYGSTSSHIPTVITEFDATRGMTAQPQPDD
jgi:hypothetical protein